MKTVTEAYIEGIRDGRQWLKQHGDEDAHLILENLNGTIKRFDAQHPVGQGLRGERDFWKHYLARKRKTAL